jgi:two-component system, response regulator PdtaR
MMPMPILLLTAFSETDLVEQATDLPIHGYLVKPIQPAELAAAIAVARKRFDESLALLESNEKLKQTLAMRKLVDRAKGKLMETGLSEAEAYHAIQQLARDSRQDMAAAAQKILTGE